MSVRMSAHPKVSIVMPVYNGGSYFELALQSALAQTYANIEIIIVNDGSTDQGATDAVARLYVERHPNKVRYIHQSNTGVAGALNTAIRELTGEFFCWLSHDDLYAPEKTSVQVAFWQKLGQPDAMLISDYTLIDQEGKQFANVQFDHQRFMRAPMLPLFRGAVNGCTVFIPTALLRTVPGPFDVSRRYTQDFELWRQLIRKTDFFHVPQSLVHYRVHPDQDTQRSDIVGENETLWQTMVEETTELERVQMYGSSWRFYEETRKILAGTSYVKILRSLEGRRDRCVTETLVSVVMPVVEADEQVLRSLSSVLNQTHRHLDIVLVTDGTTPLPDEVVREGTADARVRLLRTSARGIASSRSFGLKQCRGDYIAFIDPGAEFRAEKIARQLRLMQLEGLDWSVTGVELIGSDGVDGPTEPWSREHPISAVMVGRSYIAGPWSLPFIEQGDITPLLARREDLEARRVPDALVRIPAPDSQQNKLTLISAIFKEFASIDARRLLTFAEQLSENLAEQQPLLDTGNESLEKPAWEKRAGERRQHPSPGDTPADPPQVVLHATRLYERGYLDEALAIMEHGSAADRFDGRLLLGLIKRALGRYAESLAEFQALERLHPGSDPVERVRRRLATALAFVGLKDEARAVAERYRLEAPQDLFLTVDMGSAFAVAGDFEEADRWFSQDVVIRLNDDGLELRTSICRFDKPLLGSVNPYRIEDPNPPPAVARREGATRPVLLLSGDARYHRLFLEAAIQSFDLKSGVDVLVHVHVIDPDDDVWRLIDRLRRTSRYEIQVSSEFVTREHFSDNAVKSYYTVARLLVLPEILETYNSPVIVSDLDQIVINDLRSFVGEVSDYDAALLYFKTNVANIPSRFSASLFVVSPTEGGHRFAKTARRYILGQLQECQGVIPWHLDQVALAYAQLSDRQLRWCALPQTILKIGSDLAGAYPSQPTPLFWAVVASTRSNRGIVNSSPFSAAIRRVNDADRPQVLVADFDMFAVVGGGQVLFRALIERNPGIDFHYFSRGLDLELKERGELPFNALPIRLVSRDFIHPLLPHPTWDTTSAFAYIALEMAAACAGRHFDCIDTPSYVPSAGFFREAFQIFGVKSDRMITSLHGWISVGIKNQFNAAEIEGDRLLFIGLEDASLRACDAIYTVSNSHNHDVVERFGDAGIVIDMHNVLNQPVWPAEGIELPEKPDIWFVGRLDRNKGPDLFVDIVSSVPTHLYRRIMMAGPDLTLPDGETCWDKIRTQAISCGLNIEYVGELLPKELQRDAYNGKNIIIIPSRSDTFNLVALEAITRFTPVLLSTAAGALGFMQAHHPDIPILDMSPDDVVAARRKLIAFLEAYPASSHAFHDAVRNCNWPEIQTDFMFDVYVDPSKKGKGEIRSGYAEPFFVPLQPDPRTGQRIGTWETFDPQLTIIVPTYRRPEWLVNCLASIAQERPERTRVLVIDDGSPADMRVPEIASAYLPFVRVITTENRGEANAVNLGIAEADTPFLMILSDDDVIEGAWPAEAIRQLQAEPDVTLVYPNWSIINGAGELVENHDLVDFSIERLLGDHWCLPGPGAVFRREDALAIGGRNGSVRYVSDYDFWLRLSSRGRFKHVPVRGAYWRDHGGNATLAKDRQRAHEHIEVIVRELLRRREEGPEVPPDLAARALATAHLCAGVILSQEAPDDVARHVHFALAYLMAPETVRTLPVNISVYQHFYPDWLRTVLDAGTGLERLTPDDRREFGRVFEDAVYRRVEATVRVPLLSQ